MSLDFLYREYESGDETSIVATFNKVFEPIHEGFVPRTIEEWRWQFAANPSGHRIFLATTEEGQVVSQFAGLGQRARLDGEACSFVHGVDSFTDPSFRGGLKRPGHFIKTAQGFVDRFLGADRDVMMWGFPVWQAWRIGQRFLKEEMVRSQHALTLDADDYRLEAAAGVDVEEVERFPDEVDELFERSVPEHGAIQVRDAAHLNWRFSERPGTNYRIALARRAGSLVGYAVYRADGFDGRPAGLLCDWLVPGSDRVVGHALRNFLIDCARAEDQPRLIGVFPDYCAEWVNFQRARWIVEPSLYFVVARSFHRGVDVPWLRSRWYYTLGDTDLC